MKSASSIVAAALCWAGIVSGQRIIAGGSHVVVDDGLIAVIKDEVLQGLARHQQNRQNASTVVAPKTVNIKGKMLDLRQSTAQCGTQGGGARCPGDQCCSSYGFCGDTIDHCHPLFDCQANYGSCGWPREPPAPPTTSTTSTTSSTTSTTSAPPPPPTTTSSTTTTTTTTTRPTSTTSVPVPTPTGPSGPVVVTTNGQCGNNTVCVGATGWGPCCSQFFWCGSSVEYCGAGCHGEYGACLGYPGQPPVNPPNGTTTTTITTSVTSTSTTSVVLPPTTTTTTSTSTTIRTTTTSTSTTSSAPPTPTVQLPPGQRSSTDGRCGSGQNCLGSTFGRCCSQFGWCGDGDQFCPYIVGCQSEFGYCEPAP